MGSKEPSGWILRVTLPSLIPLIKPSMAREDQKILSTKNVVGNCKRIKMRLSIEHECLKRYGDYM